MSTTEKITTTLENLEATLTTHGVAIIFAHMQDAAQQFEKLLQQDVDFANCDPNRKTTLPCLIHLQFAQDIKNRRMQGRLLEIGRWLKATIHLIPNDFVPQVQCWQIIVKTNDTTDASCELLSTMPVGTVVIWDMTRSKIVSQTTNKCAVCFVPYGSR